MGSIHHATAFIIHSIFEFASLLFALRFLLRFIRADFYNPVSQFIVKITQPLMSILHKLIPVIHRVDVAALVALMSTHLLKYSLIWILFPQNQSGALILIMSLADSLEQFVNIYFWAIMLSILFSWMAPYQKTPLTTLLAQVTEPILSRVRAKIPPIAGFDLSPIPVLLGLQVLKILIP